MNTRKRPVNLDLTKFKFPIMAIISILHRVSGVILFLALPFFLYQLQASLNSTADFTSLQGGHLLSSLSTCAWWLVLVALSFHIIAGIRHLLMDFGVGEQVRSGRIGAIVVLVVFVMVAIWLGVWLW